MELTKIQIDVLNAVAEIELMSKNVVHISGTKCVLIGSDTYEALKKQESRAITAVANLNAYKKTILDAIPDILKSAFDTKTLAKRAHGKNAADNQISNTAKKYLQIAYEDAVKNLRKAAI